MAAARWYLQAAPKGKHKPVYLRRDGAEPGRRLSANQQPELRGRIRLLYFAKSAASFPPSSLVFGFSSPHLWLSPLAVLVLPAGFTASVDLRGRQQSAAR